MKLVGREKEVKQLKALILFKKNILIEGPVGVGKTFLVREILDSEHVKYYRVDGDSRYSEQKLAGWYDPALVMKTGYQKNNFIPGPLMKAMLEGGVLFVNELNRMPESVQNILLPAMDEKHIEIPVYGTVQAHQDFFVIATQNPHEFGATVALSEALQDRFEKFFLGYQSEEEEREILKQVCPDQSEKVNQALNLVRRSRSHSKIKRGASIRAAQSVVQLMNSLSFEEAALLGLSSRIELKSFEDDIKDVILELLNDKKTKKKRTQKAG